jgi:hypothetical protein
MHDIIALTATHLILGKGGFDKVYGKRKDPPWPPRDPSPVDTAPKSYWEMRGGTTGAAVKHMKKVEAFVMRCLQKPGRALHMVGSKTRRVFRRKKRIPGTNVAVEVPHVDGKMISLNEYKRERSADYMEALWMLDMLL